MKVEKLAKNGEKGQNYHPLSPDSHPSDWTCAARPDAEPGDGAGIVEADSEAGGRTSGVDEGRGGVDMPASDASRQTRPSRSAISQARRADGCVSQDAAGSFHDAQSRIEGLAWKTTTKPDETRSRRVVVSRLLLTH